MMTYPERNALMVGEYEGGLTLEQVARKHGVTRERVRQIVRRAGSTYKHSLLGRRYVSYVVMTCEECGKQEEVVPSTAATRRFCSPSCYRRATQADDEAMLTALRDLAARLGRTPSIKDVNADEACPWHPTYYRRFGSMSAAQIAAGLKPNGVGGSGHVPKPRKPRPERRPSRQGFWHRARRWVASRRGVPMADWPDMM